MNRMNINFIRIILAIKKILKGTGKFQFVSNQSNRNYFSCRLQISQVYMKAKNSWAHRSDKAKI